MGKVRYYSAERVEFLSRELDWQFRPINVLDVHEISSTSTEKDLNIVLIGNDRSEIRKIRKLPKRSVWVLLYADETYQPRLNFDVLRCGAVIGVLRSYGIPGKSFRSLIALWMSHSLMFLKTSRSFSSLRGKLGLLLRGQIIIQRQYQIRLMHRLYRRASLNFVPGYTNLFAKAVLNKLGGDHDRSLSLFALTEERQDLIGNVTNRKFAACFVGQKGNSWRQFLIEQMKLNLPADSTRILLREKFGGTEGSNGAGLNSAKEYLETLLSSQFAVCPGGNYSSATFRLIESLIAGCVPVVSLNSPSDPGYEIDFLEFTTVNATSTWGEKLQLTISTPPSEIRNEAMRLRKDITDYFTQISACLLHQSKGYIK